MCVVYLTGHTSCCVMCFWLATHSYVCCVFDWSHIMLCDVFLSGYIVMCDLYWTCYTSLCALFGTGYATASPKPSIRAPWWVGNAVVGRGNSGWTMSKNGHPCLCQNSSEWPSAEKSGRGSVLNHPLCPLNNLIGQGTELN